MFWNFKKIFYSKIKKIVFGETTNILIAKKCHWGCRKYMPDPEGKLVQKNA